MHHLSSHSPSERESKWGQWTIDSGGQLRAEIAGEGGGGGRGTIFGKVTKLLGVVKWLTRNCVSKSWSIGGYLKNKQTKKPPHLNQLNILSETVYSKHNTSAEIVFWKHHFKKGYITKYFEKSAMFLLYNSIVTTSGGGGGIEPCFCHFN